MTLRTSIIAAILAETGEFPATGARAERASHSLAASSAPHEVCRPSEPGVKCILPFANHGGRKPGGRLLPVDRRQFRSLATPFDCQAPTGAGFGATGRFAAAGTCMLTHSAVRSEESRACPQICVVISRDNDPRIQGLTRDRA